MKSQSTITLFLSVGHGHDVLEASTTSNPQFGLTEIYMVRLLAIFGDIIFGVISQAPF